MWTEATLERLMLISSRENQERWRRTTARSLTSMTVGNILLPRVQRLAVKVSGGHRSLRF